MEQLSQKQVELFAPEKLALYLYLSAAYSDFKVTDDEIYLMKEKLSKHGLIRKDDFDQCYHDVLALFKSHNDFESQMHIEERISRLGLSMESRKKLYEDIKDITKADGHEEDSE